MQLNITYHIPTINDEKILREYVQEHYDHGETHISASLGLSSMNYSDWIDKLNNMSLIDKENGWGRSNLYMVCFNDQLIGLLNIRYEMNEELQNIYGNIGYGVRPSARNMGFATEILRHALKECKNHGMKKAVLGCVKSNIASSTVMLRCGGQLIKETNGTEYKPGIMKQYYQFRLEDESNEPELWDLYDKNRNIVATDHIRGQWPIPGNCYHLVVHVWLKNAKGEYLIAQRSAKRKSNPLMWECQGGSVTKGEDSLAGAIREVKEEVGIDVRPENGKLLFSRLRDVVDGKRFGDIMDVWLFEYDGESSLLNATTDEVAQTKWMPAHDIKKLYDDGKLVKTLGYFFEKVAGV